MLLTKFRLFILSLTLLTLVSCGPLYSTRYSYIPPSSTNGRMCVNQCLSDKSYCVSQCNSTAQSCISSAQILKIAEDTRKILSKNNDHYYDSDHTSEKWRCERNESSCKNECSENYRYCYENCGGEVLEERYCSAFCNN